MHQIPSSLSNANAFSFPKSGSCLVMVLILGVIGVCYAQEVVVPEVEWEKTYGGSDYDEAYSIQQTKDGGYIVAGETDSFGAGDGDFYIIKLSADVVGVKEGVAETP